MGPSQPEPWNESFDLLACLFMHIHAYEDSRGLSPGTAAMYAAS